MSRSAISDAIEALIVSAQHEQATSWLSDLPDVGDDFNGLLVVEGVGTINVGQAVRTIAPIIARAVQR